MTISRRTDRKEGHAALAHPVEMVAHHHNLGTAVLHHLERVVLRARSAGEAVQEVVRRLKKGSIPIENEAEIEIQNIVASANLGGKVHLEEAARTLPKSMYEPEQFPGLIHRMPDPKTVILLFASGKLVCTGAKKEADVYRSVNNLHVMLEEKGLMVY